MARDDLTEEFADLVALPEVDLARGALLIEAHAHRVDVEASLGRLDALAARVGAGPTIELLCHTLFELEGFTGNRAEYYDPANSFLSQVVSRRTGIPITLTIVAIEVGRRCGVDLAPLSTPGHFTAVHHDPSSGEARYLDAFNGRLHDWPSFQALFSDLPAEVALEDHCEPVTETEVLARVLRNLGAVYRARSNRADLVWVSELAALLPGAGPQERLDRAAALAGAGAYDRAAAALEAVADDDEVPGRDRLVAEAARMRARLN